MRTSSQEQKLGVGMQVLHKAKQSYDCSIYEAKSNIKVKVVLTLSYGRLCGNITVNALPAEGASLKPWHL